jgi:hypothetical protein
MEQQKQLHINAYAPWTEEEERQLKTQIEAGKSIDDIVSEMGRNKGAILSRMKKMGLLL